MTSDELQEHKKRVELAEGSVKQLEKVRQPSAST